MVSLVEALVIVLYSVLVVRIGYTGNVVLLYHVQSDEDICRGCVNPVTVTGYTNVDSGVNATLELVDKFC